MITIITEILNQLFFLLVFILIEQKLAENNRCVVLSKSYEKKGNWQEISGKEGWVGWNNNKVTHEGSCSDSLQGGGEKLDSY